MPSVDKAAARAREIPLLVVGTDHHHAPLELRERVAYSQAELEDTLVRLIAVHEIEEALLLSTCNRTEAYLRHSDDQTAFRSGLETVFLARSPEIQEEGRFFVLHGDAAARHLLRVAAGLESMVLGEPEILGQVKQAATTAEQLGTSGAILGRLTRSASAAGRRARAETQIGAGAVSFGYAAVDLARNIFDGLEQCSVLVLGAGETATTVARSLVERGAGELRVANRSRERAEAFRAELPQAEILPFEERQQHLGGADLIVAATGAPEPIVRRADVDAVLRQRKGRPLLIVDLGVPRDVEPEVGELRNVFLHDIDSLEQLIEHNLKRRREEVADVEAIVDHELDRFRAWYGGLEAAPVVAQLHRRAEEIRLQEIEKHREKFPAEIHEHLDSLTRSIVRKILHHPSAHLRERSDRENLHHIAVLKDLFRLDEADADPTERDRAGGDEPERDE